MEHSFIVRPIKASNIRKYLVSGKTKVKQSSSLKTNNNFSMLENKINIKFAY